MSMFSRHIFLLDVWLGCIIRICNPLLFYMNDLALSEPAIAEWVNIFVFHLL